MLMADAAAEQLDSDTRISRRMPFEVIEESSPEVRAAQRKAARIRYRAYCIACGRSSESASPPPRLGRCQQCGGTMLVEPVTT
jgi:DNA-directed RNA polymerase subunit RPC12/RpoP